jgi:hypothetical protein
VRWAAAGAIRTVGRFVAVSWEVSPLKSYLYRTRISVCSVKQHTPSIAKEGGWNRKIRRATKPAKYAPNKRAAEARPRRQPDDFPAARHRKIGEQSEGPHPRGVAVRRNSQDE